MRHNSVVIDTTHDLIHFPHLKLQANNAASAASAETQSVLFPNSIAVPPRTTKINTANVDRPSKWHTTGTVIQEEKLTETASWQISHSMWTILDKKQQLESPTQRHHHIQSRKKHKIPNSPKSLPRILSSWSQWTILSIIPESDPDVTTYLNELLKTNKPEPHNNTLWFPTPKNFWQNWGSNPHTDTNPQRTAWIERKRKTEPKYHVGTRKKFLERSG